MSLLAIVKEASGAYRDAKEAAMREGTLTPEQQKALEAREEEAYAIASRPAPPPPASLEAER